MAAPNPQFADIATTTLNFYARVMADNVTNNNSLLERLNSKGQIELIDGGETIVKGLDYAENGTVNWYSGYEILDISPSQTFTSAQYVWKQCAGSVLISGLEMRQNNGSSRIYNLLKQRGVNMQRTFENFMSTGIYSNGTAAGGKQIGGLQLLVADTPSSGTVGGINAATSSNAFWRNQKITVSAFTTTTIQGFMDRAYLATKRNTDVADLIVADNNAYLAYWKSLQAIQRITDATGVGAAGYARLKYMGSDVVFDGGQGGACPTNHMYFLNTNYLGLTVHEQANYTMLDPIRSINQDAFVRTFVWMGNMTCSNRKLQAVLSA